MTDEFTYHRPKRSKASIIGLGLVGLVILSLLGGYFWYRSELQPVSSNAVAVSFEVPVGQRAPEIASRLKQTGLIRNRDIFLTYVNLHGLRGGLQAGTYSLASNKSTPDIANILSQGKITSNLLVIPEGSTLVKIEKLASQHGIPASDFKTALSEKYQSQYAMARPPGVDLEGYLFPDGYQVTPPATAHSLIQSMLTNFDQKLSPDLASAFAAEGLSVHQGLTLASVIEREVANSADRPIVAQVFLSRIKSGQGLQSDVTVQYAADQAGVAFNLNLDSPYNTYRSKTLPPGPICSPGIDSIAAAAHPSATTYVYFLAGKDGKTHFAHTFAEHQANIAKYLH